MTEKKQNISKREKNKYMKIITIIFCCFVLCEIITSYYTNYNYFYDLSEQDDGFGGKTLLRNSSEFIIDGCGSETILDTITGLCWLKDFNLNGSKSWTDAMNYCDDLNLGGKNDWYLPNRNELLTLSNENGAIGATKITLENIGFENIQNRNYWTKTPASNNPTNANTLHFEKLTNLFDTKAIPYYFVCVRNDY